MSVFNFDNHQEFGLFFKINSNKLLELCPDEEYQGKINDYIKVFDHAKGGCGCNINKRRKAAAAHYEAFIPELFTSPIPMSASESQISSGQTSPLGVSVRMVIKEALGNPSLIQFKKDATDQEPFFSI